MSFVLVDSSVWIAHFRKGDSFLEELLRQGRVLLHDLVLLELAAGSIPHRRQTLKDLQYLPRIPMVSTAEILEFIERHRLFSKGLGAVDFTLIACAKASAADLLTYDKKLTAVWNVIN